MPTTGQLRRWATAALVGAAHGRDRREITLRIVAPAESRTLNRRYRKKDKPTNVLSFPYDPLPRPLSRRRERGVLGDIVICAAVVNREAREQGKRREAHWAHMVVHGVLHLLGFDHIRPGDAKVMERRERAILARLSFPDPYA